MKISLLNLLFFLFAGLSYSDIAFGKVTGMGKSEDESEGAGESEKKVCCNNHAKKPIFPSNVANYDCSQLKTFGAERCNEVWGGYTCAWETGKQCKKPVGPCQRVTHYESHHQHSIDVGRCEGLCKKKECGVTDYSFVEIKTPETIQRVRVIESCSCDKCIAIPNNDIVEIPVGKCKGNCNTKQKTTVCKAGIDDDFDVTNGLEVSNPSSLLLSGFLNGCSGGIQNGFDVFTNDRCFGHTFTDCLQKGPCNLQQAHLRICMRAAQVSLTQTDSLILGVNGNPLWGKSLPILNGGTWNPDETLCLDLDLDNLPIDSASILSMVGSVGHLDVGVQDDTAVDYLVLKLKYEDCQKCVPTSTSISTLYQDSGVTNYENIKDCDCVDVSKCHRADKFEVHYPGTKYETLVDKGQCIGGCQKHMRCLPEEVSTGEIKSPEGSKKISKIKSCKCSKILWNGFAEILK